MSAAAVCPLLIILIAPVFFYSTLPFLRYSALYTLFSPYLLSLRIRILIMVARPFEENYTSTDFLERLTEPVYLVLQCASSSAVHSKCGSTQRRCSPI